MNNKYDALVDIQKTEPEKRAEMADRAVTVCESIKDYHACIIVPDRHFAQFVLNDLYESVKDSEYTASEFVSAKKDRISFVNGSYIDIKITNNKEGVIYG